MKKRPFIVCLMFIPLLGTFVHAQEQIEIGNYKIILPDSTTGYNAFGSDLYFKIQNDTIYYYEVESEEEEEYYMTTVTGPTDDEDMQVRFNKKIVEVDVFVFPVKSIDIESIELHYTVTEKSTGELTYSYTTLFWSKFDNSINNYPSWHYHYKPKGKMKKDPESFLMIHSNSRAIYYLICSLLRN